MLQQTHPLLPSLPLLLGILLGGCSQPGAAPGSPVTSGVSSPTQAEKLRILLPRQVWGLLPSGPLPPSEEARLAERFAASLGLEAEYIYVDRYDQLIPRLLNGDGDVIIDNLTISPARQEQLQFTTPINYISELIIARKGESPKGLRQLGGRRIAVHASSPYYETLQELQKRRRQPPFEIELVEETLSAETILIGVAEGVYDLAITDNNRFDLIKKYRHNLEVAFDLGTVRAIAWGVHPNNSTLLNRLNDFLGRHYLASDEAPLTNDDLTAIKQRGVLRVLTRNNAITYFLWRGELLGFEYELAKHFARQHGLRVEMVVPPSRDLLLPWLQQGKGDIIAASLTIEETLGQEGTRFSRPYNQASSILISRRDEEGLDSPEGLYGRTVVVRRSSASWKTLKKLQGQGIPFHLQAAPEGLEDSELIARVASGEYDLTVTDNHILDLALTWRDDIKAAFPLGIPQKQGWLVRDNNPQLLQAVNDFFRKEYRGEFYNVTYRKYFESPRRNLRRVALQGERTTSPRLSPYDDLIKKYAKEYGLDWRLLVSQMYQESRFNPEAKSWMGAMGLMQVMPQTAMELGLEDLHHEETGLHAGVKYLHGLLRYFEPELAMADRTWLALAAYNAGIGHVLDARQLAEQLGLDPNQWFGHVEQAMLLLSKPDYAKKARHGYVRGYEPVKYVREIRDRYHAYLLLAGGATTATAAGCTQHHLC